MRELGINGHCPLQASDSTVNRFCQAFARRETDKPIDQRTMIFAL